MKQMTAQAGRSPMPAAGLWFLRPSSNRRAPSTFCRISHSGNSQTCSLGLNKAARFIAILTAGTLMFSSCIFDAGGDRFYRTLWSSSEAPLGKITLEFLCGEQISIKATEASGSFGTYATDRNTAYFDGLTLDYADPPLQTTEEPEPFIRNRAENTTIIIEEAHKNGDRLTIYWHVAGSSESHSTQMLRRNSAE